MKKNKNLIPVLMSFVSLFQSCITNTGNNCSVPLGERQQFPALIAEQVERRQALEAAAINGRRQDSPKRASPCWTASDSDSHRIRWGEPSMQRVAVTIDGRRTTIPLKPGGTRSNQVLSGRVTNEGLRRESVNKCTHNGETVYIEMR